jgi:hypothetical protein
MHLLRKKDRIHSRTQDQIHLILNILKKNTILLIRQILLNLISSIGQPKPDHVGPFQNILNIDILQMCLGRAAIFRRSPVFLHHRSFSGQGHRQPGSDLEEEVRRLKEELLLTQMERDILKKAVAIFSKPQK